MHVMRQRYMWCCRQLGLSGVDISGTPQALEVPSNAFGSQMPSHAISSQGTQFFPAASGMPSGIPRASDEAVPASFEQPSMQELVAAQLQASSEAICCLPCNRLHVSAKAYAMPSTTIPGASDEAVPASFEQPSMQELVAAQLQVCSAFVLTLL